MHNKTGSLYSISLHSLCIKGLIQYFVEAPLAAITALSLLEYVSRCQFIPFFLADPLTLHQIGWEASSGLSTDFPGGLNLGFGWATQGQSQACPKATQVLSWLHVSGHCHRKVNCCISLSLRALCSKFSSRISPYLAAFIVSSILSNLHRRFEGLREPQGKTCKGPFRLIVFPKIILLPVRGKREEGAYKGHVTELLTVHNMITVDSRPPWSKTQRWQAWTSMSGFKP